MRSSASRTRLAALAATLALSAGAGAGCGSDDAGPEGASASQAPKAGALLGDSLRAMERQKSASVALGLDVAGRSTDPQLAPFLGKPISARIQGGFSDTAVAITGAVEGMGRKERIEARADRGRSFVRFGGTWYGPGDGLDRASDSSTDPAELRRAVAVLREHGDRFVKGTVRPGPELDGPTWQVSGPLDADGIIAAARAEGEAPDADEQQALRLLAPLVKVTFAAGRQDRLPRRLAFRVDVSKAQVDRLRALAGGDADDVPQVDELRAGLTIDMTRWGAPVTIQAPADPEPFESLYGAIGGALLAAGG